MKRILERLTKQVVLAFTIASLILSPIYSLALERNYLGNVSSVNDINQLPTVYRYDNTEGDSGRYMIATLGHTAVDNIYAPVSIEVRSASGDTYTVISQCHIGQLCAQQLGNGDVTVYNYRYNLNNNPYQSLSKKAVYQRIKGAAPIYREVSQASYHYNLIGALVLSQAQDWLSNKKIQHTLSLNIYDMLGRLVSSNTSGPKSSQSNYRYDANGNLIWRANANFPLSLIINGIGEAIKINGQSIAYDGNGNELNQVQPRHGLAGRFQFNARNELVGAIQGRQQSLYGYSANGIRWSKSQLGNPVALHYYNQGAQLLNTVETRQQSGQVAVQNMSHYLLAGQHVSRLVGNLSSQNMTTQYYLPGEKGSVRGHLNSVGQLTDTAQYTAYGALLNQTQIQPPSYHAGPYSVFDLQSHDPFAYDGEQRDVETKLIYLRARYYDPNTTRFISQDSFGLMNRYAFANGDPVNQADPSGHISSALSLGLKIGNYVLNGLGAFAGLMEFGFALRSAYYMGSRSAGGALLFSILGMGTSAVGMYGFFGYQGHSRWMKSGHIALGIGIGLTVLSFLFDFGGYKYFPAMSHSHFASSATEVDPDNLAVMEELQSHMVGDKMVYKASDFSPKEVIEREGFVHNGGYKNNQSFNPYNMPESARNEFTGKENNGITGQMGTSTSKNSGVVRNWADNHSMDYVYHIKLESRNYGLDVTSYNGADPQRLQQVNVARRIYLNQIVGVEIRNGKFWSYVPCPNGLYSF